MVGGVRSFCLTLVAVKCVGSACAGDNTSKYTKLFIVKVRMLFSLPYTGPTPVLACPQCSMIVNCAVFFTRLQSDSYASTAVCSAHQALIHVENRRKDQQQIPTRGAVHATVGVVGAPGGSTPATLGQGQGQGRGLSQQGAPRGQPAPSQSTGSLDSRGGGLLGTGLAPVALGGGGGGGRLARPVVQSGQSSDSVVAHFAPGVLFGGVGVCNSQLFKCIICRRGHLGLAHLQVQRQALPTSAICDAQALQAYSGFYF